MERTGVVGRSLLDCLYVVEWKMFQYELIFMVRFVFVLFVSM